MHIIDITPPKIHRHGRGKKYDLRRMSVRLLFLMLLAHIVLMGVFVAVEVRPLVAINIAGIFCFSVLIALLTSSRLPLSVANNVALIEIILHTASAILLVGWNAGFSKYCIALVSMVFFWSRVSEKYDCRFRHPLVISLCIVALYFILLHIYIKKGALYEIPAIWTKALYVLNSVISFAAIIAFAKVYSDEIESIERKYRNESNIDELTRIYNRRKVREILGDAHEAACERGVPYSVAMIDIDDFKSVNDTWGHNIGDYALTVVAKLLMKHTSDSARACRWGGDEFLLIGTPESEDEALQALEAFRHDVEGTSFKQGGVYFRLTVTIGMASYKAGLTIAQIIANADEALYIGKSCGKNCVKLYEKG